MPKLNSLLRFKSKSGDINESDLLIIILGQKSHFETKRSF